MNAQENERASCYVYYKLPGSDEIHEIGLCDDYIQALEYIKKYDSLQASVEPHLRKEYDFIEMPY